MQELEGQSTKWREWLNHPQTKEFRVILQGMKDEILEAWVAGAYTAEEGTGTLQKNSEAIGRALILGLLITIDPEELSDAEKYIGT